MAYDIIGYVYYLEDGVEEHNVVEYNLAAHVHFLGSPARTDAQFTGWTYASDDLILPADITASGFYVTNANNYFRGNAASGGWSGFAFPLLAAPLLVARLRSGLPVWKDDTWPSSADYQINERS